MRHRGRGLSGTRPKSGVERLVNEVVGGAGRGGACRHAQLRPIGLPRSPGGGNRSSSAVPGWRGPRSLGFLATMGDPSKQDILTIFKRLRSVPTNKVTTARDVRACPVPLDPAGGPGGRQWPRPWEEEPPGQ